MSNPIRFRVRPVYHGSELLIELLDDPRKDGFPRVAEILRDALGATIGPPPDNLNDPRFALAALAQDRYFTYWSYPGGNYEIDDDIWGLFVFAKDNNKVVIADLERVLLATGQFVKESVDFEQFK
ncbi:hypothetical protein ISN76_00335 [Dyella halodurans]|uniref:Uncharacterized protein n=2 Tax=Dyella halodurans TaxID=1920171 RepID=A0ABV9BXU0_9GAMM